MSGSSIYSTGVTGVYLAVFISYVSEIEKQVDRRTDGLAFFGGSDPASLACGDRQKQKEGARDNGERRTDGNERRKTGVAETNNGRLEEKTK